MVSSTIWITAHEAHALRLLPEGVVEKRFKRDETQTSPPHNQSHYAEAHQLDKFFKELSEAVVKNSSDRFLIAGPGPAKIHFKKYLDEHFPRTAVVGVETTDYLSDQEILDFTHRFFKHFDVIET